jgi:putative PEP-CTERM system histidine kinase
VTPSVFATASAWSYGLALAVYLLFGLRAAVGSRASARGRLLIVAVLATALWAGLCIPVVLEATRQTLLVAGVADALRYGAWFAFLWHLMQGPNAHLRGRRGTSVAFAAVGVALAASVLSGEGSPFSLPPRVGHAIHVGLAVLGLILTEQVVRRIEPGTRWGIKPLAVAMAGLFGFELFLYADALLYGHLDADIWLARGFARVLLVPFLAVATARNAGWTVDLHLSRVAVFHSSALLVSGAFLLAVAGAGYFVRYFGGTWGRALQIELLFAATLLVVLVGSSGRFRSKLKVFVSKHFFSYRYDYREEWLRFTRTISTESLVQTLQVRTIAALADLVESPAGLLFLSEEPRGFVDAARWNMPAADVVEPADGSLPAFLKRTGWIVSVPEYRTHPERYAGLELPHWLTALHASWLVVPLAAATDLLGFVVLTMPRTAVDVDWEVRDLLKTASRQAASYLGQGRATEALLEARKFDAFNRMSAFVVHDLKNLVAQLSLMLRNAQRHRDNPAFQADMLATVAHVVERMNGLMLQLRAEARPVDRTLNVDLDAVLRRVCATKADARVPIDVQSRGSAMVVGHEERLEHVIGHLVQTAIDASLPAGRITASVATEPRFGVLTMVDEGIGMSPEFMRERLFKPFETTKPAGMGIGVYESQQYVASLGGSIRVESREGAGTRVEVRLPLADATPLTDAARAEQEVA